MFICSPTVTSEDFLPEYGLFRNSKKKKVSKFLKENQKCVIKNKKIKDASLEFKGVIWPTCKLPPPPSFMDYI